jgi:hypothetical protein
MVRSIVKKVKPKHGFSHFVHLILVSIVPLLAYIFIRLDFFGLAMAIVLLSKWRMFAVKPRHWVAHIRTNAVDIIVSLSLVAFMITSSGSGWLQLFWLATFEIWLLFIKPRTSTLMVSLQALIALCLGTIGIFLAYETAPIAVYVLLTFIVAYFCGRHFFAAYDEPNAVQYSWLWAFFSASLVWILSHWLLFYDLVAQPAVLLSVIGYGLAGLYYLHEHDKLTQLVRRQIIFVVFALVFVMLAFANWGEGIVK